MKASDLFVKALENEGVDYVFGIPWIQRTNFCRCCSNATLNGGFI